ncbi:MAG: hypothetical protein P8012_16565, partial [Desulfobacterales bacterium]
SFLSLPFSKCGSGCMIFYFPDKNRIIPFELPYSSIILPVSKTVTSSSERIAFQCCDLRYLSGTWDAMKKEQGVNYIWRTKKKREGEKTGLSIAPGGSCPLVCGKCLAKQRSVLSGSTALCFARNF